MVEVMGSPNPKTICALPFKHFCVGIEGTVRICCVTSESVSEHGAPMSMLTRPMDDIWNSAYMRNVRRAMLEGERLSACEVCYANEAASGQSYRTIFGLEPVEGEKVAPEELMAFGAATGYRVDEWPRFIKLEISNLCNLKCRMCYGGNSSQIERDPVHSRWAGGAEPLHALWRGAHARIGPEPRIGVRSSGLFPLEEVGESRRRWTDGHAVFNVPLRSDTKLEALEIEFHEGGPFGQNYQVIVNGRRCAGGVTDPARRRISVDLSKIDHKGRLVIEIPSSRSTDKPGGKDRGVPLQHVELRRRDENLAAHPQVLAPTKLDAPWYAHDDKLFGDLLRSPETLNRLYVTGGEPLINDRFEAVVDHLLESGAAGHIDIELSTNCTHVDAGILAKLRKFRSLRLFLSLDAVGDAFEYIRHPARWSTIDRNVRYLKESFGSSCLVTPTVQIYNILGITDLFRYCDEMDLNCGMSILYDPARLAIGNLPPRARAVASERLIKYHDEECPSDYRKSIVRSLATYLRDIKEPANIRALREFMLFTNDLDVTRGQDFRTVHAELVQLMAEDGFDWTGETLHAKGDTRNRPARDRAFAWV